MSKRIKPKPERESAYREMIERAIEECGLPHGSHGVEIAIMETDPRAEPYKPLTLRGRPCAATVKLASSDLRQLAGIDAIVTFDSLFWDSLPDDAKVALCHHELTHIEVLDDADSDGRPKLKTRLHDYEIGGFYEVMARHGAAAPESLAVAQQVALRPNQFMPLFDRAKHLMTDGGRETLEAALPRPPESRVVTIKMGGSGGYTEMGGDE